MKAAAILGFSLYCSFGLGQSNSLLINEVQAANDRTIEAPGGSFPDWLEIYNPTSRSIDMLGMRLVVPGQIHVIDIPLKIPPKGFRVLWCDGTEGIGADHLSFKLSRNGGSVILIASDGVSILDVFTWPQLYADESLGRRPDGSRTWKIFPEASPGRTNKLSAGSSERPPALASSIEQKEGKQRIEFSAIANTIRYTLDGSDPSGAHARRYTAPIEVDRTTAIRARACDEHNVAGPEYARTIMIGEPAPTGAIILDSLDLWDRENGIGTNGPTANYSRTGREWERPAFFQLGDTGKATPVGIRISGSGSRTLPKRSYKLYGRRRYGTPPDVLRDVTGQAYDELMLRADASPNAFLRNLLMEKLVLMDDLDLAVQPSLPLSLLINGRYEGLYRLMPPKDEQWLQDISGAKNVDVLDGPAYEVLTGGSNGHFLQGLDHLRSKAPIDTLKKYFDLGSLIDLACIDMFTGRGDHDLNVRIYRPREKNGVWRWVLFDMDLWAPVEDNSLQRMLSANTMESPYLPEIIAHDELRRMFLKRFSALVAGTFDPKRVIPLADSLHHANRTEQLRDHERWKGQLQRPDPDASLAELKEFFQHRGEFVLEHLADRTGRKLKKVDIEVPDGSLATMFLDGSQLPAGRNVIGLFEGIPMDVEIQPKAGVQFQGWTGVKGTDTIITFDPKHVRQLKPRLRR